MKVYFLFMFKIWASCIVRDAEKMIDSWGSFYSELKSRGICRPVGTGINGCRLPAASRYTVHTCKEIHLNKPNLSTGNCEPILAYLKKDAT